MRRSSARARTDGGAASAARRRRVVDGRDDPSPRLRGRCVDRSRGARRCDPFHPIGLPHHGDAADGPGMSCDPNAQPDVRGSSGGVGGRGRTRCETSSMGSTAEELERSIVTSGDGYPPAGEETQVIGPLWTVLEESWWHNRFMNRDLDVIVEGNGSVSGPAGPPARSRRRRCARASVPTYASGSRRRSRARRRSPRTNGTGA